MVSSAITQAHQQASEYQNSLNTVNGHEISDLDQVDPREAIWPTYSPPKDIVFEYGEGCELVTESGERYLDFISGIAVTSLGHAHPELVETLKTQAEKLWHLSNLFRVPKAETLAKKLCELSFADAVFFTNSGAESVEAGIKAIRGYFAKNRQPHKYRIIGFEGSFHGRTLGTLAAAGNSAHCNGFIPFDYGFDHAQWGDIDSVNALINEHTAGILVEPIQGEGGICPATEEFLRDLRALCDQRGLLLMYDEIQCGVARTGKVFAYQHSDIAPDVMSLAKGLGGGFPVGACLAKGHVAQCMTIGTHGTTYGGNPLAMAVASKVIELTTTPEFLAEVTRKGEKLTCLLESLCQRYPNVVSRVDGRGLMLGVECVVPNTEVLSLLREHRLLVGKAGKNMIRLLPALIVTDKHIAKAVAIMEECFQKLSDDEHKRVAVVNSVSESQK